MPKSKADTSNAAAAAAAAKGSAKSESKEARIIVWPCHSVVPSKRCESAVLQVLHRKGEWGRGIDLSKHRIGEIQAKCDKNNMTLFQAFSLRRNMLRSFPGGMKRVTHSRSMGTPQGQQDAAELFERAVASFLSTILNPAMFLTESELRDEMRAGTRDQGPTPDILFLHPVQINGRSVQWIDAKMYYASVTYANNKKMPNGKLRKIAQRYNDYYGGTGAFVFRQGFCSGLASIVPEALLLDASPLDLTELTAFQDAHAS